MIFGGLLTQQLQGAGAALFACWQGSPAHTALLQAADQLPFIRFISFISHFFNAFDVSLVSSQVTVDFKHCVEEDNSFY